MTTEVEKQNIEYKRIWKDEYLKWVCGFANAQGGKIYIGVTDDKEVIGINDPKKLSEDIPNKIQDTLGIIADCNILFDSTTGKPYLEIIVESYPYPINYKGEYHYRCGSTKQELRGAALNKFLLERTGRKWDGVPVPNVTVKDLSLIALQRFRREAAKSGRVDAEVLKDTTEVLLNNLHLYDDNTGYMKRAAILLFHPDPEKYYTGAYIKIGFFLKNDADLAFQDEVHGSLMEQIDKASDLLKTKYITYAISYEGVSRREKPTFPEVAMRESLLNAVAHKDYSTGVPIQISVYPDRIVYWNPGTMPEQVPLNKLFQKHSSFPFNPDIANALFRCGDIEAWGRGYSKILESIYEHKLLPPQVDFMAGLMLTYYANMRTQLLKEHVDERLIKIIEYVRDNEKITNSDTQKLLNVSKPTATRLLKQSEIWLEQQGKVGMGTNYIFKWRPFLIGS
ncbi:MAG: putative DNA binding domain-containing protein [Tannerellaceae bacterium]|jgi:ATP-dependent DNA helicase RecG|nr:putative DNA binding domain-containing protein [Tannerellaceae bacterium]